MIKVLKIDTYNKNYYCLWATATAVTTAQRRFTRRRTGAPTPRRRIWITSRRRWYRSSRRGRSARWARYPPSAPRLFSTARPASPSAASTRALPRRYSGPLITASASFTPGRGETSLDAATTRKHDIAQWTWKARPASARESKLAERQYVMENWHDLLFIFLFLY